MATRRRRSAAAAAAECRTFTEYANIAEVCNSWEIGEPEPVYWAGGTLEQARKFAAEGDLSTVKEVERRMDSILLPLGEAGMAQSWERAPVGAFPSVPDYLAGNPMNMWQRQPVMDERAEVSVFINHGGTEDLTAKELKNYGASVAALLLELSRQYTVRARVFCGSCVQGVMFDLKTPLDISEICAVFCQSCTFRQGTVGILKTRCREIGRKKVPVAPWEHFSCRIREVMTKYGANEKSIIVSMDDVAQLAKAEPKEAARILKKLMDVEAVR